MIDINLAAWSGVGRWALNRSQQLVGERGTGLSDGGPYCVVKDAGAELAGVVGVGVGADVEFAHVGEMPI